MLLIFLVLEGLALHYYASSSVHTRARLLSVSNNIVGGIYGSIAGVEDYLNLAKTNRLLEARVEMLENEMAAAREYRAAVQRDTLAPRVDSLAPIFPLEYVVARVVRNSVDKRENFLMVDRGTKDGVERGMAVVSLDGYMVGYVESASEHNAVCLSVLNTEFRASGMVAGTGQFGSISWSGGDPRVVALNEVPKYTEVARGDQIVTSGYSFSFPKGIHIGTVEDFEIDEARASYEMNVRLGVDVGAVRVVLLIKNPAVYERIKLEEEVLGEVEGA